MSYKSITVLIVEDDFLNRRLTKKILFESEYKVIEAKDYHEALTCLENSTIDVIILDINLGEKSYDGINLGQYISKHYNIPYLYLTAYDSTEIIKNAISTKPVAYLTKPLKKTDLIAAIELAIFEQQETTTESKFLMVKDDEYLVKIELNDIDFIESDGNYLFIHCQEKTFRYRSTIKHLIEKMSDMNFIQTHRAFLVNKHKIDMFNNKQIVIKNHTIPISKTYIPNIHVLYVEK